MIKLVRPSIKEQQLCEELVLEARKAKSSMDGASLIDQMPYIEWLEKVDKYAKGQDLPMGYVQADTFLVFNENILVGFVNIRHKLNKFLLEAGGHIGYMIRPTQRNKGNAKALLKEALRYCEEELELDKVLITCDPLNIGSKKTILANGGVFENQVENKLLGTINRYWITLKKMSQN